MKSVSIGTDCLPADELIEHAKLSGYDVAITSVTERELGSNIEKFLKAGFNQILETIFLNESKLDNCVLADDEENYFEKILQIISNGSLPKPRFREPLSKGHLHQLRNALILEAYSREKWDIFVTNDKKGFIKDEWLEKLQDLLGTRILTKKEFFARIAILKCRESVKFVGMRYPHCLAP